MTTIIGIETASKCVIGADSQVTDSSGRVQKHTEMLKISQIGDFLIAGSGEVNACDIAQHLWIPPKLTKIYKKNIYHFVISKVIPSLRAALKENGYNFEEEKDKNNPEQRFHFLLAVGGRLFDISEDLSVTMSEDGFYGVGNGSSYALGALHNGATIRQALEIAASLDAYTSEPFQIVEQFK